MESKFSFACVIYYTFKCFCTCVGLWEYNSTCFLKGLVTCILLSICMVDQTQMYPSSILPSGLFQGIICNSEWEAEMGTFEAWITGGPKLEGGLDLKGGDLRFFFLPCTPFCQCILFYRKNLNPFSGKN